jgi:hypothetical protein
MEPVTDASVICLWVRNSRILTIRGRFRSPKRRLQSIRINSEKLTELPDWEKLNPESGVKDSNGAKQSQTEPNGAKRSQTEVTGTPWEASRDLPWVAADKKSSVKHPTWDLRTPSGEVLWSDMSIMEGPQKPWRALRGDPVAPLWSGNFRPFQGWRGCRQLRGLRRASAAKGARYLLGTSTTSRTRGFRRPIARGGALTRAAPRARTASGRGA